MSGSLSLLPDLGRHFKLSAAKEARSTSQHLCADLHPAHGPHPPWASPGGTAPVGRHEGSYVWAEASGYILCLQTLAYVCLGVCSRNSRKTREKAASKHWTDLIERWGRNLEVKNCLKSCHQKECVLLFASTRTEDGRIMVNSNGSKTLDSIACFLREQTTHVDSLWLPIWVMLE